MYRTIFLGLLFFTCSSCALKQEFGVPTYQLDAPIISIDFDSSGEKIISHTLHDLHDSLFPKNGLNQTILYKYDQSYDKYEGEQLPISSYSKPFYSPDNVSILYFSTDDFTTDSLGFYNLQNQKRTYLLEGYYGIWSDDGSRIIFRDKTNNIYIYDVISGEDTKIWQNRRNEDAEYMTLMDNELIFSVNHSSSYDDSIIVLSLTGGMITEINFSNFSIRQLEAGPENIVFVINGRNGELHYVDLQKKCLSVPLKVSSQVEDISWSNARQLLGLLFTQRGDSILGILDANSEKYRSWMNEENCHSFR